MPRGQDEVHVEEGAGLLKCEANAETPGKPTDPNAGGCVTKVVGQVRRRRRARPRAASRSSRTRSRNDCITFDDTAAAEAAVDSCVARFVAAIDPPPITQTKCGAGKKKCVSKYLGGTPQVRPASRRRRGSRPTRTPTAASTRRRRSTPAASTRPRAASRSSRRRRGTTARLHGRLGDAAGPGRGLRRRPRRPR